MAPLFVTMNVTGCPALTVISAGSIRSASVSFTSMVWAPAPGDAADGDEASADGDAVAPPPEQAATARTSAGARARWRSRMMVLLSKVTGSRRAHRSGVQRPGEWDRGRVAIS